MDIQNLVQRREAPGAQQALTKDQSSQGGTQFTGALSLVEGGNSGGGSGSPTDGGDEKTSAKPEPNEQERLQAERIARFGSFTAYSLWRKIPVMAMGIMQPKSDATFEKHGLLDEWHKQRDAWQGKVSAMSDAERAATGATVLDGAPAASAEPPADVTEAVAATRSQVATAATVLNGTPATSAGPPAETTETTETVSTTQSQSAALDNTNAAAVAMAPAGVSAASKAAVVPTEAEVIDPALMAPQAAVAATSGVVGSENQTAAAPAPAAETVKSQEQLQAERIARFGSFTAYSLWRKIPVMAMGIMQPKDDATFEKHGLLEEWHKQRDAWQGKVSAMSDAERAATGATVLDTASTVTPPTSEQSVVHVPAASASLQASSPQSDDANEHQSQPAATVKPDPVPAAGSPDENARTDAAQNVGDTRQAVQTVQPPVKSQEELQAERVERFGSFTAYSLWRKIPVMAMGIMQPKDDATFEKHGLLEEWHKQRDAWQGKVAAMSEEERAATGTSLLDSSHIADVPSAAPATSAAELQGRSGGAPDTSTEPADQGAVDQAPSQVADSPTAVQEIEEAKSQEELRAERLERFGSYTAYSLWRKIPVMAMGLMQPKDDATFERHGLLDYWHDQRDLWQGKIRSMSEVERSATGASLLEDT